MTRRSYKGTAAQLLLLLLFCLLAMATSGHAATVEVVSSSGFRVWLVEDHRSPVLTLGFRFAGGSAEDPIGKDGLAQTTAEMFFQGGGDLGADDYLQHWSEIGTEINIEARMESIRGSVRVLTPDRDKAMELLALAIHAPRFDEGSLKQIREQIRAEIDRDATDPESRAYRAYDQLAYAGHPRARPVVGTRSGIAAIQAADIVQYRRHVMVRDRLSLAAVGDITPAELAGLVDRVFAALPAHGQTASPIDPASTSAKRSDLMLASNQAEVVFGLALPGLSERERLAAELINYTLGGSAFTSRLYHEVREKRGLAYSIGTSLDSYSFMAELSGSFDAAPATVEEAIGLVRQEFAALATRPPTDAEIDEAKAALAGQYLRGLIRQADMANELTLRMSQGQRPDVIETYAGRLAELSAAEVRELAKRIPWLDRLVVVTVGAPASTVDQDTKRSRLHPPPAQEP